MNKKYTFAELMEKSTKKLKAIKKEKQTELYVLQKGKQELCANIMALQNLIEQEMEVYAGTVHKCDCEMVKTGSSVCTCGTI